MAISVILSELAAELETEPRTKKDAVYILSRVRKILESEGYPEKFTQLNFYCNLSLHAKLTRPANEIGTKLIKIKIGIDHTDERLQEEAYGNLHSFISDDFHRQLELFCQDFGIDSFYARKKGGLQNDYFGNVLLDIWSDVPVLIKSSDGKEYNFVIEPGTTVNGGEISW